MDFKCSETLKYPLALTWETMRDYLPDIAMLQDDIEFVRIERRTKKAKSLHVVSTWKSDPPLPSFLKGVIKPEMLIWTDDATWDNENHVCHFNIITHYKVEDITCVGTIEFEDAAKGKNTKITYSGVFTIAKTAKSSMFMTGFVIRGIEALAGTLIAKNFAKAVKALGDTIKAQKAGTPK
ncbi:MAG: hypothetical protein JWO03_3430 [Bacteroidetes bacterium]|nr:hypothetical protein [Bacteroidota bacterium]